MRAMILVSALLWCGAFGTAAGAGDEPYLPGQRPVADPSARALSAHAIYPAAPATAGESAPFGGNAVFLPHPVYPDAPTAEGPFPLVVLSHGMYGHRYNQTWLAEALAKKGVIAVAANHPGTTTLSREKDLSRQVDERVRDIGRMIDAVLADEVLGPMVDETRIAAIGHSLGGLTVLAAAGARMDEAAYTAFCADHPDTIGCKSVAQLGVVPGKADWARLSADLHEPRLSGVVALDPGGTVVLSEDGLGEVRAPVLLMVAGRTPELVDRRFESDRIAPLIPAALLDRRLMESAGHFDFLGKCTPVGLQILREEEPEDAVVCDLGQAERARVHAEALAAIAGFLGLPAAR